MRAKYADRQKELEEHVYEIRDGSWPDCSCFNDLRGLPSEFLQLHGFDLNEDYFFIINLDREVFTINFGIHWKLGNIPRSNGLWYKSAKPSIYWFQLTVSLDICPDEYIGSPALELPEPDGKLGYPFRLVAPKTDISEARKVFLTRILAKVIYQYKDNIIRVGMEWSPASFPFRELIFALVSIASGGAKFFSFPSQACNPRDCPFLWCESDHLPPSCGFLDREWAGNHAPLLEFGSMSHRPGDAPGVAPPETMYWVEDVLVSLSMNVDGEAITRAVAWGFGQGRKNFQIVVLSLFEANFAEVYFRDSDDKEPMIKVSNPVYLSPLRQRYCMSTHPRERPAHKGNTYYWKPHGEKLMESNCTGTARQLQSIFPGLAALVNFFEVAANRRVSSISAGIFSLELYDLILDFVDYDTWKTCTAVSTGFRSSCLRKYRIDDETRILKRPIVRCERMRSGRPEPVLSFQFENIKTGNVLHAIECDSPGITKELNWMPLIGSDRKALMLDVVVQFEPAEGINKCQKKTNARTACRLT